MFLPRLVDTCNLYGLRDTNSMSRDSGGKGNNGESFDAGVSEQSIRRAIDYAKRLRAHSDGDLIDFEAELGEEPITLDKALSELPRMLSPRRTGMYRVPSVTPTPPKEET